MIKPEGLQFLGESLISNTLDGLAYCQMIFDAEGYPVDWVYLWVNKNFEELTGLKDATGKKVTELIPGIAASNPELFEACGRVALSGAPERFEIYTETLLRWFWVSVYSPEKNFFVAVFQNITERKGVEQDLENAKIAARNVSEDLQVETRRLAETMAKNEAILVSIGEGLVATDQMGRIILINGAFERMLGWSESEVKGRELTEVLRVFDDSGKELPLSERPITKILTGKTIAINTITSSRYRRKDGSLIPMALTAAPILTGPLRNLIGAVEVFRDITIEKELDRVKSEFISITSHQLRTPLTAIQWVVERFTKKEKLTPKGMEYLDDIHMSAKRLTTMVDLMLNLSRIEAGKIGMATELVDVIVLLKNFIVEITPLRDKKELKLVFNDYPTDLVVKTDKDSLRNIVQSLVSNAIEYTPAGGSIDVSIQKKEETFVMTVKDTGIGIPAAEQSQIFQKFVRATNAKLYKTDGTGIGLYVAERLVSRLGGKIWFASEEGKGSIFYVELPLDSAIKQAEKVSRQDNAGGGVAM